MSKKPFHPQMPLGRIATFSTPPLVYINNAYMNLRFGKCLTCWLGWSNYVRTSNHDRKRDTLNPCLPVVL